MAAGSWVLTDTAKQSLLNGTIIPGSDTFKMALLGTGASLTTGSTTWASVSANEVSNAGYVAGGEAVTLTVSAPGATITVDCTDEAWTASGATLTAKYAVIYEVGGNILAYCELETGGSVSVTAGNTLTVQIHASGVFTLA